MSKKRSGGQILVDALKIHGVEMAFCVPGESYLDILDALYDSPIKLITCRQEGSAAYMAEAYGKLTGKPGICFVTRGPGAANASVGVHTAFQDSTPMILFIGQVARDQAEREAFQEVDFRRMYGPLCKWVAEIDDASRIPELISQAFHRALNGRPGPVVLALPEDMLTDRVEATDAGPYKVARGAPSSQQMQEFQQLLKEAKRPFLLLGGGGWDQKAVSDMKTFAMNYDLPVGCAFRCQDLYDNGAGNYAGDVGIGINPKLAERIKNSDVLIAAGARLGEMTTSGYSLIDIPCPKQKLVHIHASAEELGRVYQAFLPINAGMGQFAQEAASLLTPKQAAWRNWTSDAQRDYREWLKHPQIPGPLQMGEIMEYLRKALPKDTIITNGAGNYATWPHRFYQYCHFRTQLGPANGSMGYGVPAAIAAKLAEPHRTVISFNGDGCFLMNGQELATAIQYGANVIFLVIDNGMYGTIRMHQERHYPSRVSGTELKNPDFAALARAYGAAAYRIEKTEDFPPAFTQALKAGRPALLHLLLDPEAITPKQSLTAIRNAAMT